jgi:hypothetical protein
LTSSIGIDVRVDQKLMTGTNGMPTPLVVRDAVGVGIGDPLGVAVGPLAGALGKAVAFC